MTATRKKLFRIVARPLQAFLRLQAASGILLLVATLAALLWANLQPETYSVVFGGPRSLQAGELTATFSLRALINDGLMTVFFFVVGMEVKRELAVGELNSLAKASLPALAALGGMVVPAGIFLAFSWGTPGQRGWGIPMATDIAFSIGIMTLLAHRVPRSLVVFLMALAIFDDIGGILVIALFYGHGIQPLWLAAAAAPGAVLVVMNRAHVGSLFAYAGVGALLWYTLHHGGVHAAVAGVLVGLAVPARPRRPSREVLADLAGAVRSMEAKASDEELALAEIETIERELEQMQTPLSRLVRLLHPSVAFGIMPLFALANAGVVLRGFQPSSLASPTVLGTALGLLLGKQIGIFAFTLLAVRLKWAPMPSGASAAKLWGVSILAGVGFTVALFIAALAFEDHERMLLQAKLGILLGSVVAGIAGAAVLRWTRSLPEPATTA